MAVVDHPGPIRRRDHQKLQTSCLCGMGGAFQSIFFRVYYAGRRPRTQ